MNNPDPYDAAVPALYKKSHGIREAGLSRGRPTIQSSI